MNSACLQLWLILFYKALENAQEPCKVAGGQRGSGLYLEGFQQSLEPRGDGSVSISIIPPKQREVKGPVPPKKMKRDCSCKHCIILNHQSRCIGPGFSSVFLVIFCQADDGERARLQANLAWFKPEEQLNMVELCLRPTQKKGLSRRCCNTSSISMHFIDRPLDIFRSSWKRC